MSGRSFFGRKKGPTALPDLDTEPPALSPSNSFSSLPITSNTVANNSSNNSINSVTTNTQPASPRTTSPRGVAPYQTLQKSGSSTTIPRSLSQSSGVNNQATEDNLVEDEDSEDEDEEEIKEESATNFEEEIDRTSKYCINFGVFEEQKSGRWRGRVMQFNFNTKIINFASKGKLLKSYTFQHIQMVQADNDSANTKNFFCAQFGSTKVYKYKTQSTADCNRILYLFKKIMHNIGRDVSSIKVDPIGVDDSDSNGSTEKNILSDFQKNFSISLLKRGVVAKKGVKWGNRVLEYVTLDGKTEEGRLICWKVTSHLAEGMAVNVINLYSIQQLLPVGETGFQVITSNRIYDFKTSSKSLRDEWCDLLVKQLQVVKTQNCC